jgi:hypothetical protein
MVVERVVQEDGTGCGLACVAMIAGATYAEVRTLAIESLGFDPAGPFYTYLDDLRYMLGWYGFGLRRWTPFKSYALLSPMCILEIDRPGRHSHWVLNVKCGLDRYVLDPSPGVKTRHRRDWWRLRPVGYANVFRP